MYEMADELYIPPDLKLVDTPDRGKIVLANQPIKEGELVIELMFQSIGRSDLTTRSAVQVWGELYYDGQLSTIDDFFNHSCDPTTRLYLKRCDFYALRDLQIGEEITWNYHTTEYDLVTEEIDFDCKCGSDKCVGRVKGFKYLSKKQQEELWPYLSTYLRTKFFGFEICPSGNLFQE